MFKIVTSLALLFSITHLSAQKIGKAELQNWPAPPELAYPDTGAKHHDLDYLFLDVSKWESYCAGGDNVIKEEIPARITYYTAQNELVFSTTVGIRLSGMFIHKLPQKSIAVSFGKEWDSDEVNYRIWEERNYDIVDGFVIRAHGNPLAKTFFKDGLMCKSVAEHTQLEYSSFRPVVLYLNGQYQGLFNIREKKNKEFLQNLYDIPKSEIEVFDVIGGQNKSPNSDWESLMQYVEKNNLADPKHYAYVSERIDIDNYIDYQSTEIFYVNADWPKANVKVWRHEGGKWRFLLFDMDRGFMNSNISFNQLEHAMGTDQWALKRGDTRVDERLMASTLLFRKLIQNPDFSEKFVLRFNDLLNTAFSEERLNRLIEDCVKSIDAEVNRHIEYWKPFVKGSFQDMESRRSWENNLATMYVFTSKRPSGAREHMDSYFNLGGYGPVSFEINELAGGELKINTVVIKDAYYRGLYPNKRKVTATAVPNEGYRFVDWQGGVSSKKESIELSPADIKIGIKANFEKIE